MIIDKMNLNQAKQQDSYTLKSASHTGKIHSRKVGRLNERRPSMLKMTKALFFLTICNTAPYINQVFHAPSYIPNRGVGTDPAFTPNSSIKPLLSGSIQYTGVNRKNFIWLNVPFHQEDTHQATWPTDMAPFIIGQAKDESANTENEGPANQAAAIEPEQNIFHPAFNATLEQCGEGEAPEPVNYFWTEKDSPVDPYIPVEDHSTQGFLGTVQNVAKSAAKYLLWGTAACIDIKIWTSI